jgi:uncharacterized protein YqhQ
MRSKIGRLLLIMLLLAVAASSVPWTSKIALVAVITIVSMYGLLLQRLRSRRIGSAVVGSFYDMLEQEKRRALEIIVEQKAEEQSPEDAEGNGPMPK